MKMKNDLWGCLFCLVLPPVILIIFAVFYGIFQSDVLGFWFMGYMVFMLIFMPTSWVLRFKSKQKHMDKWLNSLPLLTARAKVFAKTTNTSGGDWVSSGDESGGGYTSSVTTQHFVSFEFNDRCENVYVDVSLYNTVAENETGLLEYKEVDGEFMFISFKRD